MTGSINASISCFNQSLVKLFVTAHHLSSCSIRDAAREQHERDKEQEKVQRNTVGLLCIHQINQSKVVNIQMPILASVNAEKEKNHKQ